MADLVNSNGQLLVRNLRTNIRSDIASKLSLYRFFNFEGEDKIVWNQNSSGIFSAKQACKFISSNVNVIEPKPNYWTTRRGSSNDLKNINCSFGCSSMKLSWLTGKNYVGGFTNSGLCDRCNPSVENIMHVLRDCPKAKQLWGVPFRESS